MSRNYPAILRKQIFQDLTILGFSSLDNLPDGAKPMRRLSIAKITHPKTTGVFPRERLFRLLDEYRESPVIWVSAPAGSGKTTLVSSYLSDRKLHSIWYRVDEGDGDIATFFYYMGLAAKKAAPRTLKSLPLLTPEYLLGIKTFTLRYFENLYSLLKLPFIIVFDNYQHVQDQSQFHEVVCNGLDVLPDGINAIIISREGPSPQFARLRVNPDISLLQGEDIRFDLDESKELIRLKGLRDLSESTVLRFHERTRGWAAGLVLMTDNSAGENLCTHALSADTPQEIFDYFTTEIYDKTDLDKQGFLLKTSFLPWMTAGIATQLTGDDLAGEILAGLHRNHFFTERDTGVDPVYRYHPLFREFLLSRGRSVLTRKDIEGIQRTAAALFLEAGYPEEAAAFFLDAEDWKGFIPFIIDYAPTLMAQGRTKTLAEWLAAIPGAMVGDSPWLLYWRGQCAFVVTPAEGRAYLEQAFQLFCERGDDAGALMSWAGIADTFIYDFDDFKPLDRWIDWLDERIGLDTSFPTPEIEAAVASSMVGALVWRRPGHPAMRPWVERALSSSMESRDSAVRLLALRRSLLYDIWFGDQGGSLTVLGEIGRIVESHSGPSYGLIAAKMIKAHYYAWLGDDGDRALQLVEEGFSLADETGIHIVDTFLALMGAFAALNKGDEGEVVRYAAKFEATLRPGRRYAVFYHCILTMRYLLVERHSEALAHGIKMLELSEESGHPFPEAWARTMISQAYYETGDITSAERELAASEGFFRQVGSPYFEFTTSLVNAYFLLGLGKEGPGTQHLIRAFKLGRQNGYKYSALMFRPKVWSILCAKAMGAGIEVEYVRELIRRRRLSPPFPAAEYESWPWPVKIYTLGRFEVFINEKPLEFSGKAPRRILSLLKSLVACGVCGTSEEKLIDILWPDSDGDAAHDSFSVSLHRLRQILGNEKALLLRDGCPRLDPSVCWVDAHAFEELLVRAEGEAPEESERLTQKALMLYKGQFLEETDEPWLISCRERLRSKYLRTIFRLGARLESASEFVKAADLYVKGIEADPLVEGLYRRLMDCCHAAGQDGEAIFVYKRCEKILRSVLGIEPSPETKALYRALVR
jgi:ATP/maltotriose-dependent transcriptional regulator MalT/DNA-binding SARP family transcriptional activator